LPDIYEGEQMSKKQSPTKQDLLNAIAREGKVKGKHDKTVIIVELKKVSSILGMIKGEMYKNKKIDLAGSLFFPLEKSEKPSVWDTIKVKQSKFYGLRVDARKPSIYEVLKDFMGRTFKEGKLQDFVPKK
jgi:hypothetical protein